LGRKLPSSFTEKEFLELKYIQNYLFALVYGGDVSRILAAPVLNSVLDTMDQVIAGKVSKKLTVISGHDSTLAPILVHLNLTTPECIKKIYHNETWIGACAEVVPFASSIQF
jgi:hypothetical protein